MSKGSKREQGRETQPGLIRKTGRARERQGTIAGLLRNRIHRLPVATSLLSGPHISVQHTTGRLHRLFQLSAEPDV
jgi:hypothetical protein